MVRMATSSLALVAAKKTELRRIARGLGEAEVLERVSGDQPAARRALQEPLLNEKRLDDFLDGIARLRQRRRQCLDPDRPAAVMLGDGREIAPVHGVETGGVDFE